MKRKVSVLIFPILLLVVSCGQSHKASGVQSAPRGQSKGTGGGAKITPVEKQPEYIVFGAYCGHCRGHCTSLFRYNLKGKESSLAADTSDSYFKTRDHLVFGVPISDQEKIAIASEIIQHMPDSLFIQTGNGYRFGCPDCSDGCGLYVETKTKDLVRKFEIDAQSNMLSPEMKQFAEYLKEVIEKLKK